MEAAKRAADEADEDAKGREAILEAQAAKLRAESVALTKQLQTATQKCVDASARALHIPSAPPAPPAPLYSYGHLDTAPPLPEPVFYIAPPNAPQTAPTAPHNAPYLGHTAY